MKPATFLEFANFVGSRIEREEEVLLKGANKGGSAFSAASLAVWVAVIGSLGQAVQAASVTLAWDSSASPGVSGFRLYEGVASRNYTNQIDVGNLTNATVDGLVAGTTYYFAVTAYATNNLESDYSAEVNYTPSAGMGPPAIVLMSPADGSTYSAPANITIAANVTPNGHTIDKVQFFNGTAVLGESLTTPYSFTMTNLGANLYSLSAAVVYDSTNSLTSSAATVVVTNPSPAIVLNSPADGSSFTAPATVTMEASVAANGHGVNKVQFYNGTTLLGESAGAPYSFTVTNLSAGSYSLSATVVYDGTGTVASAPATITVSNPPPAIVLNSPVDGSSFTAPAAVTIGASVTANGHAINKVQFYNGTSLLGESLSAPYSFTVTNLSAGSYSLSATAVYDGTGSVDSAAATVTVTNPTPDIVLTSPTNGASFEAPANVTMAASVTANGHTIDKVQFFSGGALLGESVTSPYECTLTNLSAGTYSLSATAFYEGTASVGSAAATITVTNNSSTNASTLPPPWQVADIGAPAVAGTASVTNGTYTVSGAGALGGTADQFTYLFQPMTGKGQIRARLQTQQSTSPGAIAGVMMRETLDPSSEFLFVGVGGDGRVLCIYRDVTSNTTTIVPGGSAFTPNVWVRLARRYGVLYAYVSTNGGSTWTLIASPKFTMATGISFGFATASGSGSVLNSAVFVNASISP